MPQKEGREGKEGGKGREGRKKEKGRSMKEIMPFFLVKLIFLINFLCTL